MQAPGTQPTASQPNATSHPTLNPSTVHPLRPHPGTHLRCNKYKFRTIKTSDSKGKPAADRPGVQMPE